MNVARLFIVLLPLLAVPSLAGAQAAFQPHRLQRGVAAIRLQSLLRAPANPEVRARAARPVPRLRGLGSEPGKGAVPEIRLSLGGPVGLQVALGRGGVGFRGSLAVFWQP